jgi:hypothetical protein
MIIKRQLPYKYHPPLSREHRVELFKQLDEGVRDGGLIFQNRESDIGEWMFGPNYSGANSLPVSKLLGCGYDDGREMPSDNPAFLGCWPSQINAGVAVWNAFREFTGMERGLVKEIEQDAARA